MTTALLPKELLRTGLMQFPVTPPAVVSIALAALYCTGCAWLFGEPADWWGISLPWAVAIIAPWAAALALARQWAARPQVRWASSLGTATLLALVAWFISGLLEALLLPHGVRSALISSYQRLPLIVPSVLVLRWVLVQREATPAPSPNGGEAPTATPCASPAHRNAAAGVGVEVRAADGSVRFVPWVDVLAIEAAGNYVELVTHDRRWLLRRSLQSVASELLPMATPRFQRVHRCALVNTNALRALRPKADGGGIVVLSNSQEIPVSRRRWPEFRQRMRGEQRQP
jgi:LytTr DNA-binding domain